MFDGVYEELNEYRNFGGVSATFGLLWTVSRKLGVGVTLDLPWTAEASQTRTVVNTLTTRNESRTEVLDLSETSQSETKDIKFEFPQYWAAGLVWRWNNRLYTTFDVSQTLWSDFTYQAEGEPKRTPIDGSIHGDTYVEDCWSARCGIEYLWVLTTTEIPLRAGLFWEQRPAIGDPDEYFGLSLGSGMSIGKDPGKLIVDFAYMYTYGDDVLSSLMPAQEGLTSDLRRHDFFMSGIWHF